MADQIVADVKAEVAAGVTKFKAFENKVFAFFQSHYAKAVAAVAGFAASHFGVLSYLIGKIL